jgi:hypothetical protein
MSQDEAACDKVKTDTGSQGCEFKVLYEELYCTAEDANAATSVQDACNQASWSTSEEMTAACTGAGACKIEEASIRGIHFQCSVFDQVDELDPFYEADVLELRFAQLKECGSSLQSDGGTSARFWSDCSP